MRVRLRKALLLAITLACAPLCLAARWQSVSRPLPSDTSPSSASIPDLILALGARGEDDWLAKAELATRGAPAIAALLDRLRADPPGYLTQISTGDARPPGALVYIGAAARPAVVRRLSEIVNAPASPGGRAFNDEAMALLDVLGRMGPDSVPFLLDLAERPGSLRVPALAEIRRMGYQPEIRLALSFPPVDQAALARMMSASMPRLLSLMRAMRTAYDTASLDAAYLVARFGNAGENREAVSNLRGKQDQLAKDLTTHGGWLPRLGQSLQVLVALRSPEAAGPLVDVWASKRGKIDYDTLQIAIGLHDLGDVRYREPLIAALTCAERTCSSERFHALHLAGTSNDLTLVPYLIDILEDREPASSPFPELEAEQVKTMGDAAHQVLSFLTLQDSGAETAAWRKWWESNRESNWQDVARRVIEQRVAQSRAASPGTMNRWMTDALASADPVVLPFVDAYLVRDDIDPTVRQQDEGRPTGSSNGNRMRTPAVVRLLAALNRNGVAAARPRLYRCLKANDFRIRQWAALEVSCFDRPAALDTLARDLPSRDAWICVHAADTLLWLGDARPIPTLIKRLGTPDPPGLDVARFGSPETSGRDAACLLLHKYTTAPLRCESRSTAERTAVTEAWQRWWQANEKSFRVRRAP